MIQAPARWAEIDGAAISANVRSLREAIGPGPMLAAVVKADGYGHGARIAATAALAGGAEWLCVATPDEALWLREGGLDAPILLMGPLVIDRAAELLAADVRVCVYEPTAVAELSRTAAGGGLRARVHLKVDTGMARLGATPEEAQAMAREISRDAHLVLEGLWTHFAQADDAGAGRTGEQLTVFTGVVDTLRGEGIDIPILHAANSAGALLHPESRLDMVRCGLPVYGYAPAEGVPASLRLLPAMTWKARVVAIHQVPAGGRVGYGGSFVAPQATTVATIGTGYADGYQRRLSGRGAVLVGGRRAPLVGRVSMDFITADITAIAGVKVGDEVVLMGRDGDQQVGADDLARELGTIPYEVLTQVGPRVVRVPCDA